MAKDDNIFDEGVEVKNENKKPEPDDESKVSETDAPKPPKPKRSKKRIIIAIILGLIIGGSVYAYQEGIINGEWMTKINLMNEPFDSSQCNFGVKQDFFGERCISLEEFEAIQEEPKPKEIQEKPSTGGGSGGTKDVSSASDKVEIEKTNDMIGYYMITSNGDWYGDFVDIRKIPSKIEESGDMKVNFRCYKDDFAGTSTYFGTFRNVIENDLTVEVYINAIQVNSKSTDTNKALILEGSCFGES